MTTKTHKEHYRVESHSIADFALGGKATADQAMMDYLEGKLSDGYELVSVVAADSNLRFIFKLHGK